MKFLCIECDEAMKLNETRGPDEGSMTVIFGCPSCGKSVAMLTNAMETQMVRSLDIKIGRGRVDREPMAAIRGSLADHAMEETPESGEDVNPAAESKGPGCPFTGAVADAYANSESEIRWSPEAEQRLERIPFYVRPMVRKSIEQQARERGLTEIDTRMMDEIKGHLGM